MNEELKDLEQKITIGLERAYQKMLAFKKQQNSLVIISRDGKVVAVKPEELQQDKS